MVCIYVAIGKTKKQVKRVYQELLAKGCMSYTIILAAFNDDTPPVLYLTPYVAASIAEKFMMEGNDVLLVLDDLKRHADVHREISLLLGHVPDVRHIRRILLIHIPDFWREDAST